MQDVTNDPETLTNHDLSKRVKSLQASLQLKLLTIPLCPLSSDPFGLVGVGEIPFQQSQGDGKPTRSITGVAHIVPWKRSTIDGKALEKVSLLVV